MTERRTALWDGREIDLVPFIRANARDLVLKPNRSYGGFGVVVGTAVEPHLWEHTLDEAVRNPGSFVVQRRRNVPTNVFPVDGGDDGAVTLEPFYTVMGFAPSRYGLATLGRASRQQVVNVAQKGGICPVVIGV